LHHFCCGEKLLDGVSGFSQPLKKNEEGLEKKLRMGFEGKCLVK